MAATTLGFIPLQLIQTNTMGHYSFEKGFATNGTYVVVKTPTVAQQLQLTKSIKDLQNGKEINNNEPQSKPVILRCKRRVDFSGLGCKLVDSNNPSVSRRNERERKRVKMVNMGFETLRQHVPSGRKNKKMSKVETLRSAVQYIKQLKEMLSDTDESGVSTLLPENMDMDELEKNVTEMIRNATNGSSSIGSPSDMESMDSEVETSGTTVTDSLNNSNNNNTINNVNNNEQIQLQDLHIQNPNQQQQQQQQDIHNHQHQQQQQLHQQQLEQLHQQLSPAASTPDLPNSPNQLSQTEQFYQTYHHHANMFQYDNISSAYSQTSTAGSLHSPTSSVVSDSSYDSFGDTATTADDDDILSGLTSWF